MSTEFRKNMDNFTEISWAERSASQFDSVAQKRGNFLIAYTIIMVLGTICYLARSFSFFHMCIKISINLHDMIFRGVSRAKMIFFNQNPSGRILNRFARDINSVDSMLPKIMLDILDVSWKITKLWLISDFSQKIIFKSKLSEMSRSFWIMWQLWWSQQQLIHGSWFRLS